MENQEWLVDIPELSSGLSEDFRNGPILDDRGTRYLTEETIGTIGGLKVQVFSNEHPPPHFRVLYGNESANFSIKDCSRLNGGLDRWLRNIRKWHATNKESLIKAWDKNRPTGCPVGNYRE